MMLLLTCLLVVVQSYFAFEVKLLDMLLFKKFIVFYSVLLCLNKLLGVGHFQLLT